MGQVVLPAVSIGMGKWRAFGARLLENGAQPVDASRGDRGRRGPDRPKIRCGSQLQLLGRKRADSLDKPRIGETPAVIERCDVLRFPIHVSPPIPSRAGISIV